MDKIGTIQSTMYWYWHDTEGNSVFNVKGWESVVDKVYSTLSYSSLNHSLKELGFSNKEANDVLGKFIASLIIKSEKKDEKVVKGRRE